MSDRRHCAALSRWWKRCHVTPPRLHRIRQPRKNQPAMPVHQPARRQLMQPMLQPQHVPPTRQPDRPRRRLSQRLPAQERHRQRPVKQQKVLLLQSHQKARQLPAPVPRKRQKRMPQHHKNRQPLLHPQRPRRRQKLPPRHGCGGLKRGSEIFRNECIIKCQ